MQGIDHTDLLIALRRSIALHNRLAGRLQIYLDAPENLRRNIERAARLNALASTQQGDLR
jgi:hypothetical protein